MIGATLTPKSRTFNVFLSFFGVLDPPKPFQTARTCFFYPGKARQCRFSWIQVRFRPISGFWDFRFVCPGILVLGFLSFRGPGSGFKSNYEQNQLSGKSFFSKTTPPMDFKSKEGRDFQKNLANHRLLVLKSAQNVLWRGGNRRSKESLVIISQNLGYG